MALVYRAHFALVSRPIFSSKGVNTSALFVFTNTLLDILQNQLPTHIAVAFDTEAPPPRRPVLTQNTSAGARDRGNTPRGPSPMPGASSPPSPPRCCQWGSPQTMS